MDREVFRVACPVLLYGQYKLKIEKVLRVWSLDLMELYRLQFLQATLTGNDANVEATESHVDC